MSFCPAGSAALIGSTMKSKSSVRKRQAMTNPMTMRDDGVDDAPTQLVQVVEEGHLPLFGFGVPRPPSRSSSGADDADFFGNGTSAIEPAYAEVPVLVRLTVGSADSVVTGAPETRA